MKCIFCECIEDSQILAETDDFFMVYDINPIQKGHLLIISKQHYENIREVPESVLTELILLEQQVAEIMETNFDILGVTIVQNNGLVIDEGTHFHVHIIPRYRDDCFWENQEVKWHELLTEQLSCHLKEQFRPCIH